MGLWDEDTLVCEICGKGIDPGKRVGFPNFLMGGHRLANFSGVFFHRYCLLKWPEFKEYIGLYKLYRRELRKRRKHTGEITEEDKQMLDLLSRLE